MSRLLSAIKKIGKIPSASLLALYLTTTFAFATAFTELLGYWTGSGTMHLDGGQSERITCRGYYRSQQPGVDLGIAILCASAQYKVEMRGRLRNNNGQITGNWEERTFNTSGSLEGTATKDKLNFRITGGGLKGEMAVALSGKVHSVSMTMSGRRLRKIELSLSR